jgi:hypothetical protein
MGLESLARFSTAARFPRLTASALAIIISAVAPLTAAACFNDSDCDDGHFCTTDHCIAFICIRFDRDCNDFNDCTADSCSDDRRQCVHENTDFAHCEDFDLFTTAEMCCGGECKGIPDNTAVLGDRCCVAAQCGDDQICLGTICVLDTSIPTPPPTHTPTRTPTRTRTSTPDPRPALSINDVTGVEGNSGFRSFRFTVTLSRTLDQPVTFHFATADGSATAGSDYVARSGDATIPANTLSLALPGVGVSGDTAIESDESFSMQLSNVSSNVHVADGSGHGVIVNDDLLPIPIPGIGALEPRDTVTEIDHETPLTLTWTSPTHWRDLNTVDIRLRSVHGIAIWLRFDEAANTIALIHPADVSVGPAFPPGSADELGGEQVSAILADSTVQARSPDGPTVDLTFPLRFERSAAGNSYVVDAAATDDAGDVQDFDTIGTISIAAVPVCPGDCTNDAAVSVEELILGVNIALGNADLSQCSALDGNGSGTVDVNELVSAVSAALQGCAAT